MNYKHRNESEKRKSYSIFNFNKLIEDIPFYPDEYLIDNNLYGIGYSLKRYMELETPLDAYIEHGLFFGSLVKKNSIENHSKRIITLSNIRNKHIRRVAPNIDVITLGPYIHYADELIDNLTFINLKNEFGKILLVFPSHSTKDIKAQYAGNKFINEIEKISESFDSVFICLYYLDARNVELVNSYKEKGFYIVTAGHYYDKYFLSRLKSLILLSDYTMSNKVGTHVGYCVLLNRPHYIFDQPTNYEKIGINADKEIDQRNNNDKTTSKLEQSEVVHAFSQFSDDITSTQKDIVDKYWGMNSIKNKEELLGIIKNL